jgi:hypothetical protein
VSQPAADPRDILVPRPPRTVPSTLSTSTAESGFSVLEAGDGRAGADRFRANEPVLTLFGVLGSNVIDLAGKYMIPNEITERPRSEGGSKCWHLCEMLDRMLQNVRVCARLTRRRSSDVVWNQMLVRSGYQAAHLCAENTYISEQTGSKFLLAACCSQEVSGRPFAAGPRHRTVAPMVDNSPVGQRSLRQPIDFSSYRLEHGRSIASGWRRLAERRDTRTSQRTEAHGSNWQGEDGW